MPVTEGPAQNLAGMLSDHWWLMLVRGIIAILFGILAFAQPGITLATLVILFGAFAFADGILAVWTAITRRQEEENWGLLLLGGLIGIGIGIVTWIAPGVTALTLLFYVAIWAVAIGMLEIVGAIRLRKVIQGEWLLIVAGVVSVAVGIALMARPGAGALAVLWLIASYAIVYGLTLIALSFRLRSFGHRMHERFA